MADSPSQNATHDKKLRSNTGITNQTKSKCNAEKNAQVIHKQLRSQKPIPKRNAKKKNASPSISQAIPVAN